MFNIFYSVPYTTNGKKTSGTISARIIAVSVYEACRICYLETVSLKYRPALNDKVKKLIPQTNDFEELKKAYKQLDFHLEVIEIFKNYSQQGNGQ